MSSYNQQDRVGVLGPRGNSQRSSASSIDSGNEVVVQRCVIVHRDERGYGLTVSGNNPVFVQSVRPRGAAEKAGVQVGDQIIKVNGNLVAHADHMEVVKLIKAEAYVALTLVGRPPPSAAWQSTPPSSAPPDSSQPGVRSSVSATPPGARPVSMPIASDENHSKAVKLVTLQAMMKEQYAQLEEAQKSGDDSAARAERIKYERLEAEVHRLQALTSDSAASDSSTTSIPGGATVYPTDGEQTPSTQKHGRVQSMPEEEFLKSKPVDAAVKRTQSENDKKQRLDTISVMSATSRPDTVDSGIAGSDTMGSLTTLETNTDANGQDDDNRQFTEGGESGSEPIICAEDFSSDEERPEEQGPFSELRQLQQKPAHMTVFLRFVLSNCDPAPLLFYFIAELYQKMGGGIKDLKKWAYEIHSTFLADGAPLRLSCVSAEVSAETAQTLARATKEEHLRSLFVPTLRLAQNQVRALLHEFQTKRALGLGNFYGDQELSEHMDRMQEARVIDKVISDTLSDLLPQYNRQYTLSNTEWNQELDRSCALFYSIATFSKHWCKVDISQPDLKDVPLFLNRDKRIKLIKSKKSVARRGHQFTAHTYTSVTECHACHRLLWGIGYQGMQCTACGMNVHHHCTSADQKIQECKGKAKAKSMGKKGAASVSTVSNGPARRFTIASALSAAAASHVILSSAPADDDQAALSQAADREVAAGLITDKVAQIEPAPTVIHPGQKHLLHETDSDNDPKQDDLQQIGQMGSPSSASLGSSSSRSQSPTHGDTESSGTGLQYDSDLEMPNDLPQLSDVIDKQRLKQMKPKEKERQKVINELFHTERSHVRNLKIMEEIFRKPLLKSHPNLVDIIFPNLPELIKLHSSLSKAMRSRLVGGEPVDRVADLLLDRFTGEEGEKFKKGSAKFCKNQSYSLDVLRSRLRKDQTLAKLMAEQETHPYCKKLTLKDFLPMVMMRLTKYPLLINSLMKHTPPGSEEHATLVKAEAAARKVLNYVNSAVREWQDAMKLAAMKQRLDLSHAQLPAEYRNFDITKKTLVYDGPLTWRISRQRKVEVQGVLLTDMLLLLQKDDKKYVAKPQSLVFGSDDSRFVLSPFIKLNGLLVRSVATDPMAFFVVCTATNDEQTKKPGGQIYELQALNKEEKKKWFKYISEATETHKTKEKERSTRKPSVKVTSSEPDVTENTPAAEHVETNAPEPDVVRGQTASVTLPPLQHTRSAETALTHTERLERAEQQLEEAVAQRTQLTSTSGSQEPRDLVLAAMKQLDELKRALLDPNSTPSGSVGRKLSPEAVKQMCSALTEMLVQLLSQLSRAESERAGLRDALAASEQQLTALRAQHELFTSSAVSPALQPATGLQSGLPRASPATTPSVISTSTATTAYMSTSAEATYESSEAMLAPQQLPDTAPPQEAMLAATGRTVLEINPDVCTAQPTSQQDAQLHVAQIVQEQPNLETVDVTSHDEETSDSEDEISVEEGDHSSSEDEIEQTVRMAQTIVEVKDLEDENQNNSAGASSIMPSTAPATAVGDESEAQQVGETVDGESKA